MNPYIQFAIGVVATLVIALLMFAIGRKYLTQDRQKDTERGSERELKDDDRAAREKLAGQLETERKEQARTVESGRQVEAARIELDRKEAATSLEAEQRRLATRVGDLERLSSSEASLKETLREIQKSVQAHHADTALHIDPARDKQIWSDFRSEVMRGLERLEEKVDKVEKLIHPGARD